MAFLTDLGPSHLHMFHCRIQIFGIKVFLWTISIIFPLDRVSWDDTLVNGLGFVEEHVLQAPLFFMSLMRYITPTLDDLYVLQTPIPSPLPPSYPGPYHPC